MDHKFENTGNGWIARGWWKSLVVAFLDAVSLIVISFAALWIRFDFSFFEIPPEYLTACEKVIPVIVCINLVFYYLFRLYRSIWRFAGATEVVRAVGCYMVLLPIYLFLAYHFPYRLPRSIYAIIYVLGFIGCVGIRLSYRFLRSLEHIWYTHGNADRVMVVGSGDAGRMIIRELKHSNELDSDVVCAIDDNPGKWGKSIEGVPIVGGRYDIKEMVEKYHISHIIFAIVNLDRKERQEILRLCNETAVPVRTVPGVYQLINGEVSVAGLKEVEISDLLGRSEIKVNNSEIMEHISGKVVMVTGGGGSIGSELCRQIAAANPGKLIVYEIYENNAYNIQQELIRKYPQLDLEVLIGSVRNTNRVNWVLSHYKPEIIFHAAAHKHVPLMEVSPNEAIKNNPIGTYKMGTAAAKYGVKKFLLISTDKAVNPTNIMGASKRLCEMVVQMLNREYPDTDFMAVRFGNVLGSNGSVIPLFKEQIKKGGPVTVTDRNIIRYFMTIPEAVSLVLQASYYAKGGEIFVLDMGEPVRIDDMARNLIRLSGLEPDVDIKIVYTGLRPGEKLFEELLMDEEGMKETANSLIFIGRPIEMDDAKFKEQLMKLDKASKEETENIKQLVAEVVPTYHPAKNSL